MSLPVPWGLHPLCHRQGLGKDCSIDGIVPPRLCHFIISKFKEFKQTCQIRGFIGYNENAVKWQVWTVLLVHIMHSLLCGVGR